MKIYTKTGDTGETSLFAGGRVPKSDLRVETYGTVDELNSYLGLARTHKLNEKSDQWLETIQNDLFRVGSDLATPLTANADWLVRLGGEEVVPIEAAIDEMTEALPELKAFILPGGTPAAATLHVARTICRRAERLSVLLYTEQTINPHIIPYLNRLSDFLFTLARWENHLAGENEIKWQVRS